MLSDNVYSEDLQRIASEKHPWERLSGSRILVAGATGMVGSLLTDVLASVSEEYDFQVTAISRDWEKLKSLFSVHSSNPHLCLLEHDVNAPLGEAYDSIFHLASNTHPVQYANDPIGTITANVIGLNNLLSSMSDGGGGRFVFASSVEIYGQNRGDVDQFDESYCGYIDCNTLRAGYNESKRVGEAMCQAYGSQRNVDFVIPRLSRLYGPSMKDGDSKASSQFIRKASAGEDIVLKSAGTQYFSYSDITLRGMAEMLAEIAGTKVVFETPNVSEAVGYSKASTAILDTTKIRSTGWNPKVGLREGLVRTVSSLRRRNDPRGI